MGSSVPSNAGFFTYTSTSKGRGTGDEFVSGGWFLGGGQNQPMKGEVDGSFCETIQALSIDSFKNNITETERGVREKKALLRVTTQAIPSGGNSLPGCVTTAKSRRAYSYKLVMLQTERRCAARVSKKTHPTNLAPVFSSFSILLISPPLPIASVLLPWPTPWRLFPAWRSNRRKE